MNLKKSLILGVSVLMSMPLISLSAKCPSQEEIASYAEQHLSSKGALTHLTDVEQFYERYHILHDYLVENKINDCRESFYHISEKMVQLGKKGYYLAFGAPIANYYQKELIPEIYQGKHIFFNDNPTKNAQIINKIGIELMNETHGALGEAIELIREGKITTKEELTYFLESSHISRHVEAYRNGGFGKLSKTARIGLAKTPPFLQLPVLFKKYPTATLRNFQVSTDGIITEEDISITAKDIVGLIMKKSKEERPVSRYLKNCINTLISPKKSCEILKNYILKGPNQIIRYNPINNSIKNDKFYSAPDLTRLKGEVKQQIPTQKNVSYISNISENILKKCYSTYNIPMLNSKYPVSTGIKQQLLIFTTKDMCKKLIPNLIKNNKGLAIGAIITGGIATTYNYTKKKESK